MSGFALPTRTTQAQQPSKVAGAPLAELPFELFALSRVGFGARPGDADDFVRLGKTDKARLRAHVEKQLHPEKLNDELCDRKLAQAKLETVNKTLKQLWADHFVAAQAMREADKAAAAASGADTKPFKRKRAENELRQQPVRDIEIATWLRAVYSRRQLHELVVDFWHNHFNVYGWDEKIAPIFVHYDRDVIRAHALGNFRALLGAVAKSPAMLFYLDNFVNQSGNPNENFARELFELHTLGAENYLGTMDRTKVPGYAKGAPVGYVDGDVYEAARALTGWRVEQGPKTGNTGVFQYYEPWHDRFQKIILGQPLKEYQPPMKDGEDLLDLVAYHPGTSRYVCRKLCRRFIADDPPERLVESAAQVFREKRKAPDQLRQVLHHILLSPALQEQRRTKMKRPFEVVVGILRATDADFFPSEPFLNNYARAGQRSFQWRTPDGYPDSHVRWGGTTPMLERWRMANQICNSQLAGVSCDFVKRLDDSGRAPAQLARYWYGLLGGAVDAQRINDLATFLAQGRNTAVPLPENLIKERLPSAVALVLMSPEFQWR